MGVGELSTYSLADFVPFTAEVYLRLFERVNEAVFPAQIPALVLGLLALGVAVRSRPSWHGRFAGAVLAGAWAFSAWAFHFEHYAHLNWAGAWFGWAFVAQAALVLVLGQLGHLDIADEPGIEARIGFGLVAVALLVHPLLALPLGRSWAGAEVFGIAPDPTVVATLGFALAARRSAWLLWPIPVLWCLVTGSTAWVLELTSGLVTAGVGALALVLAIAQRARPSPEGRAPRSS